MKKMYWLLACEFLCVLISHSVLAAEVNGILVWELKDKKSKILLPQMEGKTPEKTTAEYLEKFNTSPVYKTLLASYQDTPEHPKGKFTALTQAIYPFENRKRISNQVPFLVVANRPGHMSLNDQFFVNVYTGFSDAGADVFILPLGLETFLVEKELSQFHALLVKSFPAMLSVGGPDIDPKLYQQENTHSRAIISQRDKTEIDLIRLFSTANDGGVFYGICRGHQAYTVSMGGSLNQDISLQAHSSEKHNLGDSHAHDRTVQSAWHPIQLVDKENSLYEALQLKTFRVNSRHHQSIKQIPNGPGTRVIAFEGTNPTKAVIESVETRDAKGRVRALTFQFHPEDMQLGGGTQKDAAVAKKILKWMVNHAKNFAK